MALSLLHAGNQLDFTPTQISGLVLWLDSSLAPSTYQSNGGSLASADGDPVGYWLDQSGNGKHAQQVSGTNKPSLKLAIQNGKSVVRYDATNDYMTLVSGISLASQLSAFMVVRRAVAGTRVISLGNNNGTASYLGWWETDNKIYFSGTSGAINSTTAYTNTGCHLIDCNYDGSSFTANFDNSAITLTGSYTASLTISSVGAAASFPAANNDVCEILLYNTGLSAGNRSLLRSYLNSKWGIY